MQENGSPADQKAERVEVGFHVASAPRLVHLLLRLGWLVLGGLLLALNRGRCLWLEPALVSRSGPSGELQAHSAHREPTLDRLSDVFDELIYRHLGDALVVRPKHGNISRPGHAVDHVQDRLA
jgi:hypothetical protein